jgi:quercetin dioxygenase-like cupin family protein
MFAIPIRILESNFRVFSMKISEPLILASLVAAASPLVCQSVMADEAGTDQPAATRQLLMQRSISLPSSQAESKLIRVHFPPGYKTPLHTHDGAGPRYVLKGRIKIEDATGAQSFGPGDVFWETGQEMTVENVGGSDAEILIFELAKSK